MSEQRAGGAAGAPGIRWTPGGALGVAWGLFGVSLILGSAIWRLGERAWAAFQYPFSTTQWLVLIGFAAFMAVGEGYRGFQKGFSPRVAARTRYLARHPNGLRVLLAPLFCMGYWGATRRRQIVTWCLTLAIIGLVLLFRLLPQPWRGILDFGVVLGLSWGLIALWVYAWQALTRARFDHDPEVAE